MQTNALVSDGQRSLAVAWLAATCLYAEAAPPVQLISAAAPNLVPLSASGGDSGGAVLSANGTVLAFASAAANLVTNTQGSLILNVYARQRPSGTLTLVSVGIDGQSGGDDDSAGPSLSADGRWVVFESRARNLVTNQTSGLGDIYVRDLSAGITRLVSLNLQGQGGNGTSTRASVTPDGRFVVFQSAASDLAANDTNGLTDIFVRDLMAGVTTLESVNWQGTASASSGPAAWYGSIAPVITPDGRYVAFQSLATNLTRDPLAPAAQVYVRDRLLGTNHLASISLAGQMGTDESRNPVLSADGRYVAFESYATNLTLVPVIAWRTQIYRRDLSTGNTLLISQLGTTGANNANAQDLTMSTNGLLIAYSIVTTSNAQVYAWDEATGNSILVTTNALGQLSQGHSESPLLSDDGRFLAFLSDAVDLATGATNGHYQLIVHDMVNGTNQLVSAGPSTSAGSVDCLFPALDAKGQIIAFEAADNNFVVGDHNYAMDVFLRDIAGAGVGVDLVSVGLSNLPPATASLASLVGECPLSADGRYVVFTSSADNLTANDTNGYDDVFVRDSVSGGTILVSVNRDGTSSGNGPSSLPAMTPDGHFVAFLSAATNLVDGDSNKLTDVFVRDLTSGTTTLASVRPLAQAALPVLPVPTVLRADGRYVAFVVGPAMPSTANNQILLRDRQLGTTLAVTNDLKPPTSTVVSHLALPSDQSLWYFELNSGMYYLYRYDLIAGTNRLIASGQSTAAVATPVLTPDGRFVAAQGLQGSTNATKWVWRYSVADGTFQTLASNPAFRILSSAHWRLSISDDGRFVAFVAPSLDKTNANDVFVADATQPGKVTLVSVNQAGSGAGNGSSDSPSLSADGRFVTFRSTATDLAPGVSKSVPNIYARDIHVGITRLVSANQVAAAGNDYSVTSWISADGTTVAFESAASNLVPADDKNLPDVFVAAVTPGPVIRVRLLPFGPAEPPVVVWTGPAGENYQVQYKNFLSDPNWQVLTGNPSASGANEWRLPDPIFNPANQRFYRVVLQP